MDSTFRIRLEPSAVGRHSPLANREPRTANRKLEGIPCHSSPNWIRSVRKSKR